MLKFEVKHEFYTHCTTQLGLVLCGCAISDYIMGEHCSILVLVSTWGFYTQRCFQRLLYGQLFKASSKMNLVEITH